MQNKQRYLIVGGLTLILVGLIVASFILFNDKRIQKQKPNVANVTYTPLPAFEPLNQDQFTQISNIRSTQVTELDWRKSGEIQIRGSIIKIDQNYIHVAVNDVTIPIKLPQNNIKTMCMPLLVKDSEGREELSTKISLDLRNVKDETKEISIEKALPFFNPGSDITMIARREQESLTAVLLVGYGCTIQN